MKDSEITDKLQFSGEDACLRRHTFLKKSVSKNFPEKKAKVAPMLSYETVKILIRVHLLSGFECIANSLFTNDLKYTRNTIAVRLRLKSPRFYES